jgi:hypothetical protein
MGKKKESKAERILRQVQVHISGLCACRVMAWRRAPSVLGVMWEWGVWKGRVYVCTSLPLRRVSDRRTVMPASIPACISPTALGQFDRLGELLVRLRT